MADKKQEKNARFLSRCYGALLRGEETLAALTPKLQGAGAAVDAALETRLEALRAAVAAASSDLQPLLELAPALDAPQLAALLDELVARQAVGAVVALRDSLSAKEAQKAVAGAIFRLESAGVEVPKVQRAAGLAVSREPVEAWISLAGGNGSRLTGFFIPGEGDSASATFQLHERLGVTDIKLNGENPRADRRVFRMLLETQEVPIMGISPSQLLWEVRQGLERSRQEHIAIPLDFYALLERIEARGHTAVAPSWKGDVDRSRVVGEDFHRVGQLVPLIMAARWTIDESVIDSMAVTLAEAASSRLVVDPVIQQERMRAAVHGLADGYFSAERRERFAGRLQGAALWLEAHIGRDEAHLAWASAEALRDPTLKPSEVCFCGLFIELQIGEYIRARMSPEMLAQAQLEGSRGAFQEAASTDDGPRIILP